MVCRTEGPRSFAAALAAVIYIERSEIEETGEYDLEGLFIRLGYAIDSIGGQASRSRHPGDVVQRTVQCRHRAIRTAPLISLAQGKGCHLHRDSGVMAR